MGQVADAIEVVVDEEYELSSRDYLVCMNMRYFAQREDLQPAA